MLMQITNNLNRDIENAPQWFKDAVELRPIDKIIEHPLGDISYSKWSSSVDTKNLIVLIHEQELIKNGGIQLLLNF